jgi:hypothetical protein
MNNQEYYLRDGLLEELEALASNPLHKTFVSLPLRDVLALVAKIRELQTRQCYR